MRRSNSVLTILVQSKYMQTGVERAKLSTPGTARLFLNSETNMKELKEYMKVEQGLQKWN